MTVNKQDQYLTSSPSLVNSAAGISSTSESVKSPSAVVLVQPGLAPKPRLGLGLRRLRLGQTLGQAKATNLGLA